VDASSEFQSALASCKREAAAAFGDDGVLLEKYVVGPRHVEVQVFGDSFGTIVSLFERDCSVQRRHQKVIEEAPAPGITPEQREALGKAARDAAGAVNYVGAGTVEFLFDCETNFYFMEMNTRLQVEHPVTEMITGLDLVEWQLRIAAGEPLPLAQQELNMHGHAIEARIYAEDPAHDFLPSIGKLVHLDAPEPSKNVRIDTGVEQGDAITPFYDPMIAKLIVWDETRELAVRRISDALAEWRVVGVANNVEFLRRLVTSQSFREAELDTGLIEREKEWIWSKEAATPDRVVVLAALGVVLGERGAGNVGRQGNSPWARHDGWRLNGRYKRRLVFMRGDCELVADVEYCPNDFRIAVDGAEFSVCGDLGENGSIDAVIDGQRVHGTVIPYRGRFHVFCADQSYALGYVDPLEVAAQGHSGESSLLAPMPGRVIAQIVEPGDRVEKGNPLLVLEAMKMEYTIHAPDAGRVESFHFAVGDQVTEGVELLHFNRENTPEEES
jgi:3-methylcrotonyl-CoA carboxylase alpha subunit